MKKFLLVSGILCFLAVLAVIGGYLLWGHRADNAIQRELQRIVTSGAPVDWSDLKSPPIPANKNAAPLLLEAFAWLEENEPASTFDLDLGLDTIDEELWDDLGAHLETIEPFFEQLSVALEFPACDFGLPADPILSEGALDFLAARTALNRVLARALVRARAGDLEGATHALAHGQRLTEFGRGHTLVAAMVEVAMSRQLFSVMRQIATAPDADVEAIRDAFEPILSSMDLSGLSVRSLQSERVFGWHIYQRMLEGDPAYAGLDESSFTSSAIMRPFLRANAARHLQLMGEAIEIADQPYHRTRSAFAELEERVQSGSMLYFMVNMMLPVLMSVPEREAQVRSQQEMTRLGLAVLVYQHRHGAWPADVKALEGVVGSTHIALDPMTGQAFLLIQTGDGLRIQSGYRSDLTNPQPNAPDPEDYRWDLDDR